jgi:hypothetical protein
MGEVGVHDDGKCAGAEVEPVNIGCAADDISLSPSRHIWTYPRPSLPARGRRSCRQPSRPTNLRYGPRHRSLLAAWRRLVSHLD